MFSKLASKIKFTDLLGPRAREQEVLKQCLLATIYDNMPYQFFQEEANNQKISIYDRAPIVTVGLGLIRTTIDCLTSFVFGEGKFPDIDCKDKELRQHLLDIMRDSKLQNIMQDAVLWGSLGSVAIKIMVSNENRIHFKVIPTQYLTPTWNEDEPDRLNLVTEKYIVSGAELKERGYPVDDRQMYQDFYFQRVWTDTDELWYLPWPVLEPPTPPGNRAKTPTVDKKRSVKHNLGFVPIEWIKNLKGGDDIDGSPTFENAIQTCIEIDYLVSQVDRGLKYTADPLLVIHGATSNDELFKDPTTALVLDDASSKADILEIKGTSFSVAIEQYKQLREAALESMGGNRGSPEKMSSVQSGTALEQLWQPTILMASDLRNYYGEGGLVGLLRKVIKIGSERQLLVDGQLIPLLVAKETFALRWGPFFEPSLLDQQVQAQTMIALVQGKLLSQKSAVAFLANEFGIEDIEAELKQIQGETETENQAQIDLQTAVAATKQAVRKD